MSVNKVILVGNVGRDPEIRYINENRAVANFSLATTERGYKTKDGVDVPERTEWHRLVVYGPQAKIVESYVHKGTQLYVEGKLQTRTWNDKEGKERTTTEILVDSFQMLGRKSDSFTSEENGNSKAASSQPAAGFTAPVQDSDDLPF